MKFILIVLLSYSLTAAQELNCKVTINTESLPQVNKEFLREFVMVVEDYMNKTRFTGGTWEGERINCTINIFFTAASGDSRYTAQAFIGSQRPVYRTNRLSPMLTVMDNNWTFNYEKNEQLYQNFSTFHALTSFLDYYAFVIIGYDLDSYDELGGSEMYKRAFDLVNMGAASGFSQGWESSSSSFSRRGLVEDLLSEKFRPFREAFFDYHYNGIDQYPQNPQAGQENIMKLINTLDLMRNRLNLNSVLLKAFFDAKHGEIIDHLATYPDKENVFRTLKKVDPAHTAKYEEAI